MTSAKVIYQPVEYLDIPDVCDVSFDLENALASYVRQGNVASCVMHLTTVKVKLK